jgi:PAS domain S-box-containing protein
MLSARPTQDALSAEAILAAAADGILAVDPTGHVTFANSVASALLGVEADELVGQPLRAYLQPSDGTFDGALPAHAEQVCWREDGTRLTIEFDVRVIENEDGPRGSVVTFRDITQRRAAEHARDELIATVSHELRSPLTSIRGSLGLLAAGSVVPLNPQSQRMLHIAVDNTDRLIRLVGDILDLERLDAGHLRMKRVTSTARELMAQAADALGGLAESRGVTLDVGSSTATVWGDRDRIVQVLINLLSNAIKFAPAGSTVWLEAEADANETIFSVRDQGMGIAADKLEVMFDKFVQVHEAGAQRQAGSGLGLAISRSIVTRHGGQIWAESALGAGTTLYVALPGCDAGALHVAA